ncbi:winged helix-turn-helix transcriptional regulator [Flavihumibacter sp. R14]|nr:winged helix-turn-helix transcriptional regulator [Flavihumibacter soli]
MEVNEHFVIISALICEPARARMLWKLLDGRAYTASELANEAGISPTSASNHLSKLLDGELVKVEIQGRHRYFSFSKPEVAYVIESLANLALSDSKSITKRPELVKGDKFCRTCYDHLAGFVGVKITEALEEKALIEKSGTSYLVTSDGWDWLSNFGIQEADLAGNRRPVTRQCLDWSERRPHLAGQLGALLLIKMLERNWFKKVQFSRELVITSKGRREIDNLFGVSI